MQTVKNYKSHYIQNHTEKQKLNDNQTYKSHKNLHKQENQSPKKQKFEDKKLINYSNTQYFGSLAFGNPKNQDQQFYLQFDTGSNELWICATTCQDCDGVNKYDCNKSQTCNENLKDQYSIQYGDGLAIGFQAYENVWISDNMEIQNMDFILITQTNQFKQVGLKGDGICGLGLNSKLLRSLKEQGKIKSNSFSLFLTNQYTSPHSSQLILGGIDEHLAAEEFKYFPINSDTYWSIKLNSFNLGYLLDQTEQEITYGNNQNVGLQNNKIFESTQKTEEVEINLLPNKAVIDSGSSIILLDELLFQNFINILTIKFNLYCDYELGSIICNCNDSSNKSLQQQFPPLIFRFGDDDKKFVLEPQDYIIQENGQCLLQIGKTGYLPERLLVLGDTFLNKFYVYFDQDQKVIGLAQQKVFQKTKIYVYILAVGIFLVLLAILFVCFKHRHQVFEYFREIAME